MLVYDAWLKMGKAFALYYYEVSNGEDTVQFAPTHYVDITADRAAEAAGLLRPRQPVARQVLRLAGAGHAMRGIESGHRHAEAFIRHVQSPDFALPLISRT